MEFHSSNQALVALTRLTLFEGEQIAPRGQSTREVLGVQFTLSNPKNRIITLPSRRFSLPLAIGELCWHLRGDDDVAKLAYYANSWLQFSDDGKRVQGSCYGKKLLGGTPKNPDHLSRMINLLNTDPSTRRATVSFIDNLADFENSKDISCVNSIQLLIRNDSLHMFTLMRSNDVFLGVPYDVFLFTNLLEFISLRLKIKMGSYRHFATSLHMYERNMASCAAIEKEKNFNSGESPKLSSESAFYRLAEIEEIIRLGGTNIPKDPELQIYIDSLLNYRYRKYEKSA
ncbi:thymidylate synthase [Roseibium marinum]|uniref:thymidylate synthase n=1 Tax=Roseibium marinum TaxID=281252 RepID=A0A2S3V2D0_9HYPH|nr:thymidylate synthase [Roseibium marinum]POF34134.1 thymidylate synthase [Roseibium marinum]